MTSNDDRLARFGFFFGRGGSHIARTMMLGELSTLLTRVCRPRAEKTDYLAAIEGENCLGKRSARTRQLTTRHLASLYSLDPSVCLFRALRYFWERDPSGHPLVALLCALTRDSVLRSTVSSILSTAEGEVASREELEDFIDAKEPGRFSKATLKSTAQNINSTWTQSGHLKGRLRKVRSRATATAGSASYALFLGYLTGVRGSALFSTDYVRLLDCSPERTLELAEEASRRGWIVVKRVGDVVEVLFPNLINAREVEWIREQD